VEVTVSSHAFEQNLEQGNDGQSDAEASEQERLRRATRKIDLGDFAGIQEDLDEADAVTVQMMQADGNKMDYKI
jgi:flagellar hook-length control protein FliK